MPNNYAKPAALESAMANRRSVNANQRRAPRQPRQDLSGAVGGALRGRAGGTQQLGPAAQGRLAGAVSGAARPSVDLPPAPPPADAQVQPPGGPAPMREILQQMGVPHTAGPMPPPGVDGGMPPPGMGKPMLPGGGPGRPAPFVGGPSPVPYGGGPTPYNLPPGAMEQLRGLRPMPSAAGGAPGAPGGVSTPGQPPPGMPVQAQARNLADFYQNWGGSRGAY